MAQLKQLHLLATRQLSDFWRATLLSLAVLFVPGTVWASPVFGLIDNADVRGAATFRYLGFPLYDARLYTPGGAPLDWQDDFGLELQYRRNLTQKDLVEATLLEMDRIGSGAPVKDQLDKCFSAVRKGDSYLAISQGPNRIDFWRNGQKTCTLAYPGIKRSFMSIFLGSNTKSASFTRRLRGQ
ncbi:MAG: hypothetical protein ACR2O2_13095 [Ruegeria sp.]